MTSPPPKDLAPQVHERLFSDPDQRVFAVLDGASVPKLLKALREHKPEHVCLYRGELAPDLAACAPYLVALAADSPFTQWIMQDGWGKHWGIFALAPSTIDLRRVRKHFRTFLIVEGPDGKPLYFRYYDPRVLRTYLPTCTPVELKAVFGPLSAYAVEDKDSADLLSFQLSGRALAVKKHALLEPALAGARGV